MKEIFLTILDMSMTASVLIPIVILIRFFIRKAPKYFSYFLWVIPAFRLCCPVSFESELSIFNLFDKAAVTEKVAVQMPAVNTGVSSGTVNIAVVPASTTPVEINPMEILSIIWVCGTAALLIYSIISYAVLYRKVRTAVRYSGNVYCVENISSPFILGLIRPKIYIPYNIDEETQGYILAHERYHIRRGDHIVKLLAFLVLSVHWFNPLCWLAFILMSQDIELSCDEKVLSEGAHTKVYGMALLSFAANKKFPSPAPLAFGEVSVKHRVKNILKWKRPRVWLSAFTMAVCICVITVCTCNATSAGPDKKSDNKEPYNQEEILDLPVIAEEDYTEIISIDEASNVKEVISENENVTVPLPEEEAASDDDSNAEPDTPVAPVQNNNNTPEATIPATQHTQATQTKPTTSNPSDTTSTTDNKTPNPQTPVTNDPANTDNRGNEGGNTNGGNNGSGNGNANNSTNNGGNSNNGKDIVDNNTNTEPPITGGDSSGETDSGNTGNDDNSEDTGKKPLQFVRDSSKTFDIGDTGIDDGNIPLPPNS